MLPLKITRYLANAVHPGVIRFFESPCLGLYLWCCISVPGRCSFQRSRSECWQHMLERRFPSSHLSSICSSSDTDFNFHQLIHVVFVVVHVVY